MDIRVQIKQIIVDRALIETEIARRAGMSQPMLNSSLRLKRRLEANELLRLCGVLGMTAEEIASYPAKPKKHK